MGCVNDSWASAYRSNNSQKSAQINERRHAERRIVLCRARAEALLGSRASACPYPSPAFDISQHDSFAHPCHVQVARCRTHPGAPTIVYGPGRRILLDLTEFLWSNVDITVDERP